MSIESFFSLGALAVCLGILPATQTPIEDPPAPTEKVDEKPERPPFDLIIGDPGPDIHADEWLTGEATTLEREKVYLIHFWASWSAPSLLEFARMSALQQKYRDKGLVVLGFTREDDRGNRLFAVKEVVKAHLEEIDYRLIWDEKGVTFENYMTASGHPRIPMSYLVDQKGRIAFLGHPGGIDETLDAVMEGKFDIDAAAHKYAHDLNQTLRKRELELELREALENGKLGDALLALDKLIELGPKFRHFAVNKFQLLMREMRDPEGAYAWALLAAETCLAEDSYALNTLAYGIVVRNDFSPKNYGVAMKLAVKANEIEEGKDGQVWNTIGAIHFKLNHFGKAIHAMEKAVEFARQDIQRTSYKRTLAAYRKKLQEKE